MASTSRIVSAFPQTLSREPTCGWLTQQQQFKSRVKTCKASSVRLNVQVACVHTDLELREHCALEEPRKWPRRAALASLTATVAGGVAYEETGHAYARASGITPCAVVTGACGGIGGEIAAGLVAQGYDVICACRSVEQSRIAAAKLSARYLEVNHRRV